jgi:hypothetical protein
VTARVFLQRRLKKIAAWVLSASAGLLVAAQAFAADLTTVQLKPSVNVESSDIRMGDIFDGAGDAALRVFGMAPGPGRSMSYSAAYVQAKAKQAGLNWDNAERLATITIVRGGDSAPSNAAMTTNVADDPFAPTPPKAAARQSGAGPDLKRGDMVQIVFRAPGMQLQATGKAATDASIGGKVRALNLRSNKTVDGTLVSPGRMEVFSIDNADAQTALLEPAR